MSIMLSRARDRAYPVAETTDRLTGIALCFASAPGKARGFTSTGLRSLCRTVHTSGGVPLMSARRSGERRRRSLEEKAAARIRTNPHAFITLIIA